MTAGLLPLLWSSGAGADVMKRIAAPMVGGMVSSAVLTLVVIPAVWSLWKERTLGGDANAKPSLPAPVTSARRGRIGGTLQSDLSKE
jgi:Cu(I)/Ag(I) efflux system membrane protein CusA/SilA